MTLKNLRLVENNDGTYDLVIQYDRMDGEFARDFFSKEGLTERKDKIAEFLQKNAKNIKLAAVRVMVAGVILTSIPFASFLSASAADRYNMSYLYFGTVQQQIEYVARTNKTLNTVSPSYFDLNSDGTLKLNGISTKLVDSMHADGIKVVPFLSNHWDQKTGVNAVKNPEVLSAQIAKAIQDYNLDGVNVDLENLPDSVKDQHTELIKLLREKIPAHKEVSVAVAANPKGWTAGWHGSYDYKGLADNSDYLMMMTYDEHWQGGDAGPVASIGFVEASVKYALSKTTPDKIVLGLPFFGRIWSTHDSSFVGQGLPINTVEGMIKDYNAEITFDQTAQSPKAEFEVKEGDKKYTVTGKELKPGKYVVWYENNQSLQSKLALVQKYNLKGSGSWALGQEPASIWTNYSSWLDDSTDTGTNIGTDANTSDETNTNDDASINTESESSQPASQQRTIVMRLNSPTALINGNPVAVDSTNPQVFPFTLNGRTVVPVRFLESLGAKVSYTGTDKPVTVTHNGIDVTLNFGDVNYTVRQDGKTVRKQFDSAPAMIEGKTCVPLRAVAEAIGFSVEYNNGNHVIAVSTGKIEADAVAKGQGINTSVQGVTSISALSGSRQMKTGQSVDILARDVKFTPANAAVRILQYKSDNPKVATVTSKGRVKAVGKGTAKITVTSHNGKTAVITVTVS